MLFFSQKKIIFFGLVKEGKKRIFLFPNFAPNPPFGRDKKNQRGNGFPLREYSKINYF